MVGGDGGRGWWGGDGGWGWWVGMVGGRPVGLLYSPYVGWLVAVGVDPPLPPG